jgi:2-polyprenyl-3-methyl-5-hydroxy-6-metoxy-1,4-benzoquinol methylase
MQLISNEYCRLNEQLHTSNEHYGVSGKRHAAFVYQMAQNLNTTDILDYGCGKSTLARNLPFTIQQYDPAVSKYAAMPEPADIVVCTDVLEHIEPELIDNVLAHLQKLTKKAGFFTVATRPAKKILADGRNAHLIIQPANWWLDKFIKLFDVVRFTREQNQEFSICVEPLKNA